MQGEFNWDDAPEPQPAEGRGPEEPRKLTIDERFAAFKENHKDVLILFERFARELRAAGHTRLGSKLIWERIRYEKLTSAHGTEMPALDNNFTSRLTRWLVDKCPEFDGYFETRKLKEKSE